MSTVTQIPETRDLDGEDARSTLRSVGVAEMARAGFVRLRYADGFSFARSLAFQLVLTLIPGVIFIVALAARLGEGRLRQLLRDAVTTLAPGPAGDMFLSAVAQGEDAGTTGDLVAMVIGGALMVTSAVVAMAQLQRGASRIYGVEADRPTLRRYAVATGLALTAGALLAGAFVLVALGTGLDPSFAGTMAAVWGWVRWPMALVILIVAFAALYKAVPNRRQPRVSWLATGSLIGVVLWFLVSTLLSVYLNASRAFGDAYGPLAGFIGLMLWAQLSSMALLYGLGFAAQLEAVRAGVMEPMSRTKQLSGEERSDATVGAS